MADVELSAGSILYEDTGGEGPVVVLVHGLLMTASLWDEVMEELGPGYRCLRPTLPLGAHRRPMRSEADLSLRGQARLLAEFLERLELEEVTLVFNDWCGAQLLVAQGWDTRVGRLVLASCETDDNYPPRLPGRVAALAARLPGGLTAAPEAPALQGAASVADDLRPAVQAPDPRRAGRPVAGASPDQCCDPAGPAQVCRRHRRGQAAAGQGQLTLSGFAKPVLVAWAAEDKVMPTAAGRRLAASFPDSHFIEIPDSRTLIPIDQPRALAGAIATFVGSH